MIEHIAGVLLHATITTTTIPYYARVSARYHDSRYETFRRCVVKRESEGIPWIVNHDGSNSAGLYQFMPFWRPILNKRLRLHTSKPIQYWSVPVQNAAFWLVLDHGKGWSNWAGGRYDCTWALP
jgi:hypothetical protein